MVAAQRGYAPEVSLPTLPVMDSAVSSTASAASSGVLTPEGVEAFLGSGGVAGLLFTASWCAAGVLLERQLAESPSVAVVPLVRVDCEAFPHLADRFQVRSLPTFVLMRGEREEGRLLGAFSGDQVRSLLDRPALARAVKSSRSTATSASSVVTDGLRGSS
jgi:thiol-disulfide isomerase/thioredoxin